MRELVIVKSEDGQPEQQLVFAEVYAPDRPDSGGDYMTKGDIQKAAYNFMKHQRLDQVDTQHNNELVKGATIVESFIARKGDPVFIEGSWVVGMHIDNAEMWDKIKKGEINGFSLEAMATASPVEVDIEIPPVVSGTTSKSDQHTHQFFVTYSDDGRFLGGRTSMDDGHSHVIKGGTVTETERGHNHRFSAVDNFTIG
jgi:hypothetical protein